MIEGVFRPTNIFSVPFSDINAPLILEHDDKIYLLWKDKLSKKEKKRLRKELLKNRPVSTEKLFIMGLTEYYNRTARFRNKFGNFTIGYLSVLPLASSFLIDGFAHWEEEDAYITFRIIDIPSKGEFFWSSTIFTKDGKVKGNTDALLKTVVETSWGKLKTYGYTIPMAIPSEHLILNWEIEMLPEHFYDYLKEALDGYEGMFLLWYPDGPLTIHLVGGYASLPRPHLEFLKSEMGHWEIKDYRIELFTYGREGFLKEVYYPKYGVHHYTIWKTDFLL
ncbi:protein of unknown function (plasmid) [Thermococcus nautili]|nr:protein of unknown function [Thermococcus nautili]